MSGALQRCLEECLKLITLSVIGNRFAVVAVEIRPPPARTKIGPLACYGIVRKYRVKNTLLSVLFAIYQRRTVVVLRRNI